jgi:hypothetical protein
MESKFHFCILQQLKNIDYYLITKTLLQLLPSKKIGPIILRWLIAAQTPTFWGYWGVSMKKCGFSELHILVF